MNKRDQKEPLEEDHDWEPSPEDFEFTDEEVAETLEKAERRKKYAPMIGIIVAALLILQGGYSLFNLFSRDSLELARTSQELSKNEQIMDLKDAVVTIQGQDSKGTGFAIHPSGYILTNHHVIHKPEPLAIIFPNGEYYHADVIDSNKEMDIALLKIEGDQLPYLHIRFEPAVEGEAIYVIGNPLTQTQIVNQGEILNDEPEYQIMKISAPIFPGHSGSPVFSEKGEVVGVVYARTVPSLKSKESSYGLAVPMDRIVAEFPVLKQLAQASDE